MSANPEYEQIVTLRSAADVPEPVPPAETVVAQPAPAPARTRPRWAVPAAITAVGLIASGALGYLYATTDAHLNTTRHELALTQGTLASTRLQLTSLQADAASKKVTADYVAMYVSDSGKVQTDYGQIIACQNYSDCRSLTQQTLTDLQSFQSDRRAANVPAALSGSDGQLGDSISAAITAVQELISGMDNNNVAKVTDGLTKLDGAMLSLAKAESNLGSEVR